MSYKKLTIISLFIVIALTACGAAPKDEDKDPPLKTGEIVDRYVHTLTTAQDKARASGEAVEKRTKDIEEAIGD